MHEFTFPNKPSSQWQDERGAQAVFEVAGATEVLASYINSKIPEMGLTDHGWEAIVSELRPDQVMVVCDASITKSAFTRGLRAIAGFGQSISSETLEGHKVERDKRTKEAMAVGSPDTFAWSGRFGLDD